ncbi:MAG: MOSC domain-containing protein, partial [Nitrospiraceae bacterium]
MPNTPQVEIGSVASLWRYPVKSMMGEELTATVVTERGLLGDRAYALVDSSDGKVATAKNPRTWPNLFDFRATFIGPPRLSANVPAVRIALPDGSIATSQQRDLNQILSKAVNRTVTLNAAERGHAGPAHAEEYWPDIEGLDYRDRVTDFALPEGTFFDSA